jgi:hypothetical protein
MATSGTWGFDLDIADIIDEAYERVGVEGRSGYDYKTARRSLDMLLLEWQNRGLNLWSVKEGTKTLSTGTASYTFDADELDIIEGTCRTGTGTAQVDYHMERDSVSNYAQIANKNTRGRPTRFWIDQDPANMTAYMWPVPDQTYTFVYYYIERIEETGTTASNNIDVPARFLPALTTGLAYHLSQKIPQAHARVGDLKEIYEEQWMLASDAAREKSDLKLIPMVYS